MNISKTQITKAGKKILSSKSFEERNIALDITNEWRAYHLHPLTLIKNSFMKILSKNNIEPVLISQRLKHLVSIEYK